MPANETIELKRDCEAIAVPSGARQVLPKGMAVRVVQARGGSYTIASPIHAVFRIDGEDADALGREVKRSVAHEGQSFSDDLVWKTLKTVYDPELPVNIVDLGLIYSCEITADDAGKHNVAIRMTLTAPGCGMSEVLKTDVERKVSRLPGVSQARVEVVLDPPWDRSRMSEAARLQLGFDYEGGEAPALVQLR